MQQVVPYKQTLSAEVELKSSFTMSEVDIPLNLSDTSLLNLVEEIGGIKPVQA